MDTTQTVTQEASPEIYEIAAVQMVNHNKSAEEVKSLLVQHHGLDSAGAAVVVENLEKKIAEGKKEQANKDILYGALWCGGGTIATIADFGYIFWGAILFGGIQLVKGLINSR